VISISAALAHIAWNQSNVMAAVSGFVMVSAIWWIYYDSFHLLEDRKLTTGHSILYSHFFLFVGLAILAALIRHAILGDLAPATSVNWPPSAPCCSSWASSTATTWRSPSCGLIYGPTPPWFSP
jgi:hypothetical protein